MKAYKLKITIKGSKPPIWRRLIVPAGLSFAQLALIFNEVMGWEGYHLNSFEFNTLGVMLEDKSMDDFPFGGYEILEQAEEIIDYYLDNEKRFLYVYDFGDDWEHKVEVEEIISDYDKNYPVVLKNKGPILPEDCGGIYGYYEMVAACEDVNHPEHKDVMEWSGDGELLNMEYDIDEVNEFLESLRLIDRTCPPMSLNELYENLGGPFMHVVKEGSDEPDYEEVQIAPDQADFLIDLTLTKVVSNLLKNTDLSMAEILKAIELDEEWLDIYEELKDIVSEMNDEIKLN